LKKCEMIQTQIRVTHDSIAFIEKTYRMKDPQYADFSILQQQEELRRLDEEWIGAECKGSPPTPMKKAKK